MRRPWRRIACVIPSVVLVTTALHAQTAQPPCQGATPRDRAQYGWDLQSEGHLVDAERCLLDVSAQDDPWVGHHRRALAESLQWIRERLGDLEITGGVPGARVFVDGVEVATLPMTQPVRVSAAPIFVQVTAPGHHTAERRLVVHAGELLREAITLAPETVDPVPTPAPVPVTSPPPLVTVPVPTAVAMTVSPQPVASQGFPYRTVGWVGVLGGAAALAIGVGLYALSREEAGVAMTDGCGSSLPGYGLSNDANCPSQHTNLVATETVEGVMLVTGGVLAVTGLVMLLAAPRSHGGERASMALHCGWGSCGVEF